MTRIAAFAAAASLACTSAPTDPTSSTGGETSDTGGDGGTTTPEPISRCPEQLVQSDQRFLDRKGAVMGRIVRWNDDAGNYVAEDGYSGVDTLASSIRVTLVEGRNASLVFAVTGRIDTSTWVWSEDFRELEVSTDQQTDGSVDELRVEHFDAEGRSIAEERDLDANGAFDIYIEQLWRGDQVERYRSDSTPRDGFWDFVVQSSFDAEDRIVYTATYSVVHEASPYRETTSTWDGACRVRSETEDHAQERTTVIDQVCDETGAVVEQEFSAGDDVVTTRREHTYDDAGLLVETRTYAGDELALTSVLTITRDEYGDKTSETREDGVDGTFELHQQWTYTCADAPASSPLIPGS